MIFKVLCRIAVFFMLAVPAFAEDYETADSGREALGKCVKAMSDIFTQSSASTGKDGIKVTCTVMPEDELVSIAWVIDNPNGVSINIRAADMRLYSGKRDFDKVSTEEAINILDKWPNETFAHNEGQVERDTLDPRPGELSRDELMRRAEFCFGKVSNTRVAGMVYFACRLKDLQDVTAEINVNGETIAFTFDGVGP